MSQNNVLENVLMHNFVIVSVDKEGYFSMSSRPMFHGSAADAKKECERLATMKPGIAYVACQLIGGARIPSGLQSF